MSFHDPRWSTGDSAVDALAHSRSGVVDAGPEKEVPNPAGSTEPVGATDVVIPAQPRRADLASPPSSRSAELLPPLATAGDLLEDAPAWLFSALLHLLVLLIMALLLISRPGNSGLFVELSPREEIGDDFDAGELDVEIDLSDPAIEASADLQLTETVQIDVSESLAEHTATLGETPAAAMPPIQMALSGRQAGMKSSLLAAYGGTASTEQAVMEGLAWLERNQNSKTALWSLSGKFADGVNRNNPEAATALALIAFQGAGYTPQSDPRDRFTRVVTRAWPALLERQQANGNFFNTGTTHGTMYTQALCTIAICELYGMTRDQQYREAAQKAIDYCVETQSEGGGWRYFPGQGGDLSVTGWFVMALQSAQMAGLNVPSETLSRISTFLDSVSRDGGSQYTYTPGQGRRLSMTAEGLLCRQYLGWSHDDQRLVRGADLLVKNLPTWENRNAYYWYYAAQVCHHMEGRHWRLWNARMRELLPAHQVQKGRERGSWDPNGDPGKIQGGRHFVTCLSIYMLEVYYRHLPIYQLELLGGS